MLEFGACPRCKLDISAERKKLSPIICNNCGYTGSGKRQAVKQEVEKNTIILFSTFCAIALGSFFQLANWDSHSLEVIPLKLKATFGMSSNADNERMGEMCLELKKYDCVEASYKKVAAVDQTKLPRLGQFEMKRAEYNEAAQTFYGFFQKGGADLEASYSYARALAQLGQIDDATKYFEQVLAARPDVLQVTVVQNYVRVLMEHKRFDQAKKLILNIRGKGPESAAFMEAEFKKIQDVTTASR